MNILNENFLEVCEARWQLAQWDELLNMDLKQLEKFPTKKKYILFFYSAYLQIGKTKKVKNLLKQAKEWGYSKKDIKRIHLSNLFYNLGVSKLLLNKNDEALKHFEKSIKLVMPESNVHLIGQTRMLHEMHRLGYHEEALATTKELHELTKISQDNKYYYEAHSKVVDIEIDTLRDKLYSLQKQYEQLDSNPIIKGSEHAYDKLLSDKKNPKQYYGLNRLDQKLEAYLDYENGYFVELGANDGINQSNTYYFEKERGWRGLLIEPILHNFLKCKKNRSNENAFACTACVSFEYDKEYINLVYSNLMTAAVGVEGDIADPKAHAHSGQVYLQNGEEPVDIIVSAKTLTSLLDKANAPKVMDLLSLDVEGAEIEVLKGVDHQKYRFKYILVESRDEEKITEYFNNYGYKLIDKLSNHDYLFESDKG